MAASADANGAGRPCPAKKRIKLRIKTTSNKRALLPVILRII
jgi:hypothetical protein